LKLEHHKLLSTFAFNFNLRRYNVEQMALGNPKNYQVWAVQVEPMKTMLKAPGTKRLKL